MKKKLFSIHLIAAAIFVLIILVAATGVRIKLQWELGILAVLMFYTSALLLFFVRSKELKRGQKIYTGLLSVHMIVALLAFIADKIFFIVVMIPLWYFIIPAEKLVANQDFIIRQEPTIMGRVSYRLYKNHTLYEKPLGRFVGDEMFQNVTQLKLIGSEGNETKILLRINNNTDSLITFTDIK